MCGWNAIKHEVTRNATARNATSDALALLMLENRDRSTELRATESIFGCHCWEADASWSALSPKNYNPTFVWLLMKELSKFT